MFQRKTTGSVVCPSCGSLVGVRDEKCYICGRANPGLWGFGPMLRQFGADLGFVPMVIGVSTVLYVLSLLLSGGQVRGGGLAILSPSRRALLLLGGSGAVPMFDLGAWWTVLSASWLHGGVLHILFNMIAVRNIGPSTVDVIGPARTIVIYTVGGACGFLLSSLAGEYIRTSIFFLRGASLTIGASASVFGLLGALVHYGRVSGSSLVHAEARRYALMLFVFGLLLPGVDNYAHAGGFIGGYATSAFFNPLTRERGDHLLVAIVCLLLSLGAILLSVVNGLSLFRFTGLT